MTLHLALLLTQILFGSLAVAGKFVLVEVDPAAFAGLRVTIGATMFVVFAAVTGQLVVPKWPDMARIAVYSTFGVVLNQGLFLQGLRTSKAGNAAVLMTTIPVFALSIALLTRRERASSNRIAGMLFAFSGALILAKIERFSWGEAESTGNLLLLANALCFAIYMVISRDVLRRFPPVAFITWVFVMGAVILGPLTFPAMVKVAQQDLSNNALSALVWVITGCTFLAYLVSAWTLSRAEASLVAAYNFIQPVITMTLAWLFLGERVTPREGLAAAFVGVGIWLANRKPAE